MSSALQRNKGSHKAKTAMEWQQRLRLFAAGKKFGRGEKPTKGSEWNRIAECIQSCPAHTDIRKACQCQYHHSVSLTLVTAIAIKLAYNSYHAYKKIYV